MSNTKKTKSSFEIDSFQREIIKNSFDTIADDMAITLMRTAYSGIVMDSLDFSTAICDPEGLTLAQGVCTPMHMGSFFDAMKALLKQLKPLQNCHPIITSTGWYWCQIYIQGKISFLQSNI